MEGWSCVINQKSLLTHAKRRVAITAMSAVMLVSLPFGASASTKTVTSYPVSSGVNYSQYTYSGSSYINHLEVNLGDPHTKLKMGVPSPIAKTAPTLTLANRDSKEGNRVVGAVNASFFDMKTGMPMYLLSEGNEIVNGGVISQSNSYYVSHPIAFGVTKDGLAEIDNFNLGIQVEAKGNVYQMTGINRERQADETIIFTPQHYKKSTGSNEFGIEIVVETNAPITSTHYGQKVQGKVVKVRGYGEKAAVSIPSNGFVLSVHGKKGLDRFKSLTVGDDVSLDLSIDDKWKDSQFMMASGPMLVKDGKRHITMDTSNWRATAKTARTAIAISKDKKQVHLVTVDSRSGYSNGMTLTQFANYLVSKGYDRALNFDGGGSTTMGIRKYGSNQVVLANRTTNASQRNISAIVEAVSTAPTGEPAIVSVSRSNIGEMLVGATATLKLNHVLDAHYNPIVPNASQLKVTSGKGTVEGTGLTYKAIKAGEDRIYVNYGSAEQSFPVKVVAEPAKLTVKASAKSVKPGEKINFTATPADASGKPIIYQPSQLTWSVTGDQIGSVNSNGTFNATKAGKGQVNATLGTKTIAVPIEVKSTSTSTPKPTPPTGGGNGTDTNLFKDVPKSYPYAEEIYYLRDQKVINGDIDGKFNPSHTLSRQHAAVILSRAFDLAPVDNAKTSFSDVPKTHRYYKEISAIANANIVGGYSDGTFNPNGQLTRAQMAMILVKAYKLEGESSAKFKDVSPQHGAYKQIHILANHGITTGNEKGEFMPGRAVNRAQFSAFLYRSMNL
ncbi:S-layer homology domain-containing protein [Sporosarcina aquimarina]|uniref:S-layer homology domain-containing protein n=1 Tax=Sporosarcina aquimarina TaxID=114975 RepID=UPI001C8DC417|nr:S-layer homology domain-containing protein [Sporosarcina aquimarina]MBY0222645.1 S-layer homology domain-containing protein [Sporosarcina aquimarina]